MPKDVEKWIFYANFVVCFSKILSEEVQDVKIWSTDTNFLNPRNWEHDRLPCANDRIIFPSNLPVITFMPESFAAKELILPVDGEIVFPRNAEIELGGTSQGACIGKDIYFKITMDFWFEPTNWNLTSNNAFPRIPNRRNAAVPHAFQVPCPTDHVHFPADTTFRVHLDYPTTSVASIAINDVRYSQSEFDDLKRTQVGSLLFPDSPNIRITSTQCTDETGCQCGNDGPRVLPTICYFMTPYCPSVECSDPIQPKGHCCPICGARIIVKYDSKFKMEQLLNLHDSFIGKAEFSSVESFTAKTFDGSIQSVFVDGGKKKGLANKVAQLVQDAIKSDMSGSHLYQIRSVEIYKSEKWEAGVPTFGQLASDGMSSGGVAALVIVMIFLLLLGAAFYMYKKRQIPGFNFARFDLGADKIELQLGTTPHEELQPGDLPVAESSKEENSKGFDNPVYGTNLEEVSLVAEESAEGKDFVENPMFMIFEDSPKEQ